MKQTRRKNAYKQRKRVYDDKKFTNLVAVGILVFCIVLVVFIYNRFSTKVFNDLHSSFRDVKGEKVFAQQEIRVPILMYHYVEEVKDLNDTFRINLNIHPEVFEQQLITLVNDGYTFMSMANIVDAAKGNVLLPEKPIVLTFDDGYRDFYEYVFPIILKHKVKVVAYIIPGFLDQPNYMTTDMVKEIAQSPYVEIGSHTMQHVYLMGASKEEIYYELFESKRKLEKLLDRTIVSFAYPYGAFDNQASELTEYAAYTSAVTTVPGIFTSKNELFTIPRIRPGKRIGVELLQYLSQSTFKEF